MLKNNEAFTKSFKIGLEINESIFIKNGLDQFRKYTNYMCVQITYNFKQQANLYYLSKYVLNFSSPIKNTVRNG